MDADIPIGQNTVRLKFKGQYMSIRIWAIDPDRNNAYTPFDIGACVPDSCSEDDIRRYMTYGEKSVVPIEVYNGKQWNNIWADSGAIAMICIILVFVLIALIATVFDMAYVQRMIEASKTQETIHKSMRVASTHAKINKAFEAPEEKANYYSDKGEVSNGDAKGRDMDKKNLADQVYTTLEMTHIGSNGVSKPEPLPSKPPKYEPSIGTRLLVSFSVYTNMSRLLSFDAPPGAYLCLNAIRFLSMCWIILGHTFQLGITITPVTNPTLNPTDWFANKYTSLFEYKALTHMQLAVDSFFLLSGCLIAISFLKAMARQGGTVTCRQMALYYFHRYWRLTPVYMILVGFMATLYMYTGSGPLWPREFPDAVNCKKSWWWHLLYINNFYNYGTQSCMGWSWYLANDMQFYIISPVIFIFLYKVPVVGFIISGILFVGNIVSIVTLHLVGQASFEMDYIKPYSRIGAYIVGVWLGYILWKNKGKAVLSWWVSLLGWVLSLGLIFAMVYGDWRCPSCTKIPAWLQIMFLSIQRQGTAIGVAWIIYACITGNGGFINTLLSWRGWIPLSRLCYTGYLIHPMINYYYNFSRMQQQYMRVWPEMVVAFGGVLTLTIGFSIVVTLLFEIPMLGIEKVIIPPPAKKKN
ncbi:unnamed protein product [Owenia fusiformis]|uniref:Acyltransferase 3 domain-containing protein n=1 Tax=Owenia fusiformis TaxID=6347 RepID=A0A8S4QAK4_OWEFU|nr:unnamed protein product [Owenia fusiformis]